MFASTFELYVDGSGATEFPIIRGDEPTGETISYLGCRVEGKTYRYAFNPKQETIADVIPKLQEYVDKETGGR